MNEEERLLATEIERRTARGWELVQRQALEAQMRRPKRFSFLWAFVWFLLFGVGIIVYLLWHWGKRDELIYLRVEGDALRVTGERRGLLRILWAPMAGYWRWAGQRQTSVTRGLAYASPVLAVVLIVVVIAVAGATGSGGETEGEGASAPAAETQEGPERIVQGVPGTQAEAEGVLVTLDAVRDPWVSDNQFIRPSTGMRFVAFDITIENIGGGTHHANVFNFKLLDVEGFAHDAATLGPDPSLAGATPFGGLGKDEKCRGWLTFEVEEGNALDMLKYDPNPFTTNDIEFHFD